MKRMVRDRIEGKLEVAQLQARSDERASILKKHDAIILFWIILTYKWSIYYSIAMFKISKLLEKSDTHIAAAPPI